MKPPRKSKAARQIDLNGEVLDTEEKKVEVPKVKVDTSDDADYINIFEQTSIEGKRKRFTPPAELKLTQWIEKHFEPKEDVHYKFQEVYEAFMDECILEGISGIEDGVFRKILTEKFPKGYSFKEDSKYKDEIKQKKKIHRTKVQGNTLKLKPKEVLERTFRDLGNPKTGLRFNTIRQYINAKYPALQVDIKPNYVENGLSLGVRFGYFILIRGAGKSGFYRLYVEGEVSDDEEEKKVPVKKEKRKKGDKSEDEDGVKTEEGESSEEAGDVEKEKEEGSPDDGKVKKKKKKKSSAVPASRQGKIIHSEPQRIEDTFPLAITFGTEPKLCGARKIANYINRHYSDVNADARLKQCLEKGSEKGFWEHVSGHVTSGTYQLSIDEFDPTDDDDMIGKIVNAIMACTEPKLCSAGLLKNYVVEFHPNFGVADHPSRFKKALERAERSGDLYRLSGIGASGSFQLAYAFTPSPIVLAAQDTESDHEYDDIAPETTADGQVDVTVFQDAYVPRPSKRRGRAREAAGISYAQRDAMFQEKRKEVVKRKKPVSTGRTKAKSSNKKKSGRKTKAIKYEESQSSGEEDEQEESDDETVPKKRRREDKKYEELYKPRPSTSRSRETPIKQENVNLTPTKAARKAMPDKFNKEQNTTTPTPKKGSAKKSAKKGKKSGKKSKKR